jgi:eukaryotic-like serine/threonine-protein kinase
MPEAPDAIDPDLEIGQAVGEYRVEAKIGQGGFGTVFKAVHPLIGKVVAIKVLARRFSVDPEMVSRFIAEARAVNQIRHHNIIDIFSFGQLEDRRHYYVMEYLDGEPLDVLLDREGRIEPAAAIPILRAIARALDAAHAKGIVHRDLKPENVFLAADPDDGWFPKLLDFGIAKLLAPPTDVAKHRTGTGIPLGTPHYMSPEQCRGKDVDHRTDTYALGILAYRMLSGVLPFDGDDYLSILMKQIGEAAPPPSSHAEELPPGVDDAIAWLMHKDPAQRPPNLITAVRALEAAFEAAGIAVGRASRVLDAVTPWPPARASAVIAKTPSSDGGDGPIANSLAVSSMQPAAARSRTALVVGAVAALALGATVFALLRAGSDEPARLVAVPLAVPPPPMPPPSPPLPAPALIPSPRPSATIALEITGAPAGSEVVLGDRVLGTAPGTVTLDRGATAVELVIRHAGYTALTRPFTPDHDGKLDAPLHRKPAVVKPSPHVDSHDLENPFR